MLILFKKYFYILFLYILRCFRLLYYLIDKLANTNEGTFMSRHALINQGKLIYENLTNIDKVSLLNNLENLQP